MAYKKGDKAVTDLVNSFGGANFADILNRLWMNGIAPDQLQRALATTSNGTNDPSDIITRLLNSGVATLDQIKAAPTSYVPPNPGSIQWPFHPENVVNGVVQPVPVEAPGAQVSRLSGGAPNPGMNEGAAPSNPLRGYPDAVQPKPAAPAPVTAPAKAPAGPGTGNAGVPAPPPPHKKPTTPEEIRQYEMDHFGSMLWVKAVPDVASLIERASREEWTPERFNAELHASQWWQTTQDTARDFARRQGEDGETLRSEIESRAKTMLAKAQVLGIPLSIDDVRPLASDAIKFGWQPDSLQEKQAMIGLSKYDPEQQGALGAFETTAKNLGKSYLINMSGEESYDWAKKLAIGTATQDNVAESLRTRAKGAYPTIADFIESGGVPRDYFSQHINSAAQLLEVDPSSIDLTDSKFQNIISYADPTNGKLRPMTLDETNKFIKGKDEYWNTGNANNQVSSLLGTLGMAFGKTAF